MEQLPRRFTPKPETHNVSSRISPYTLSPPTACNRRALLPQGGVGWGNPAERGPLMVLLDVKDSFVSAGKRARDDNGVPVDPETWKIDWQQTGARRGRPRPLSR